MVTEAGGDHIGDIICRYLQDNGVSPEYVCRHDNVKSHVSLAFLDENNDAQYIFYKDHASVMLDGKLPEITKDDVVLFGSFFAINPAIRPVEGCKTFPVYPVETVSTVGAGDNFNAGYIYAMMQGCDSQAARVEMAQYWSQDVCRQIGNNISDAVVNHLKSQRQ